MRALSLALALLGLFVLSYFIFVAPSLVSELDQKYLHRRVYFSGTANNERVVTNQHYFHVGNISVRCSCGTEYYEGKKVTIIGFVEEYDKNFYVRALRISVDEIS